VSPVSGNEDRRAARHVVVPYGAANASVRARALHWIERLESAGRLAPGDVTVHGPGHPRAPIPAASSVLLLRNVGKLTRGGRERRLLARAGLAVYDLDDGLPWDDGNLPGLGAWWKRPFPRARVAEAAARAADRVIVGNEVLAEWAAERCADVRLVPTCIEPEQYRRRTTWDVADRPVIGWIGSPATEPYLGDISEALAEVHRRTGAVLHIVSGPGTTDSRLAGFAHRTLWSEESVRTIADWDVGIMPLRDGVYERAKCGYKLLQYAASGVPAVASPVGVNTRLTAQMDGLAASTTDEWVDAVWTVLDEGAERRSQRAAKGFETADAHSYATWQSRWVDAVGW
jgi:glycosyltransferase involved in cell wall biosynthesis